MTLTSKHHDTDVAVAGCNCDACLNLRGHRAEPLPSNPQCGICGRHHPADPLKHVSACLTYLEGLLHKQQDEICQIAGKALDYPWFKDDQKNFPGATEANGVCVGDHVAESIVQELANAYTALRPAPETSEPIIDWKASYEEALRQRDALTADAERYRFLRSHTWVEAYWIDGAGGVDTKARVTGCVDHLDKAVDMERIKERPRGELKANEPSGDRHDQGCQCAVTAQDPSQAPGGSAADPWIQTR